jgi:antirestriction protein ArdC
MSADRTRHEQARERLERAVEALAGSKGWQAWVRTRSAFRRYSLHNTLLIAMQRPDTTRVAGYRAWQKLGRQVRRGEKGIAIFAPMTYKQMDGEDDETREERMFFRVVHVFDVSQTTGEPLPEPPREPITGQSHAALLPKLESYAADIGYKVAYGPTGSTALGYCDATARRIVVAPCQPANARVRTLIHELAHALGVGYDEYSREAAEVIVESAATIACASAGLDTSGESVPYIAGWGDGTTETLREYAAKVDELASELERACGIDEDEVSATAGAGRLTT